MGKFSVVEKFISIDGEGPTSGSLSVFIRFKGCNLRCSWCDTSYSWEDDNAEQMTEYEIYEYVKATRVKHVTLTGGEPIIQDNIEDLLMLFAKDESIIVHIETNGSVDISKFKIKYPAENIRYIVDYKLPESGMEEKMCYSNLKAVGAIDAYKFVVASMDDLNVAYKIIEKNNLDKICQVYLSPVCGCIEPYMIVDYMRDKLLNDVKLQLQLHKIIWNPSKRGV